jgi:hypothetical protein
MITDSLTVFGTDKILALIVDAEYFILSFVNDCKALAVKFSK